MSYQSKSIPTFTGVRDYNESREFYRDIGFDEIEVGSTMGFFKVNEHQGFYLQGYNAKDWIDNSMVFLEVDDVEKCEAELKGKQLHERYEHVRFTDIKVYDWGREFSLCMIRQGYYGALEHL